MDFEIGKRIVENISSVFVGKDDSLELLLVALLADGHVLLEDVPGVGKTLITKNLAKSIGGSLGLMRATHGLAALRGRDYVLPDDVKGLILPVLGHRIILTEEGKLAGENPEHILEEIISQIPVPQ